MKKRLPQLKSDSAAKKLLRSDLTDYLTPENFIPTTFEFAAKDKSITLRVSADLLSAVQEVAKKRHTSYQKLIRSAIEAFLKSAA